MSDYHHVMVRSVKEETNEKMADRIGSIYWRWYPA